MPRPLPTWLYHFTSIKNLPTIIEHGLLAELAASAAGVVEVDVGNRGIKGGRRRRVVPVGPAGVVADYVPFYFAPRSPMMFSIFKGNVPEYQDGIEPLAYLLTTVERLAELRLPLVFTDRNASLAHTKFSVRTADLDSMIDWGLMRARYWADTAEEPDRRERRMAECLVHQRVPWDAFHRLGVCSRARASEADRALRRYRQGLPVDTRGDWYFT